ncbi:MAG: type II toxin-antitoxin system YafQ family toxin [Bacteroidaceae bacterium]|nr:type II toxin-antitoxin system YafQ family toxin [Bacteroidaceae bacterium]
MYSVKYTKQFKRDYKLCKKRGLEMALLDKTIRLLATEGCLPQEYRPHKLIGRYTGYWECHIQPDWLLIWQQFDEELILHLTNTGSHSDLFK